MINLPWSRLELAGEFVTQSQLRVGDGAAEGGIALDSYGRPMIPASTFRGALRVYVESALRGMDSEAMTTLQYLMITGNDGRPMPIIRKVGLCCESVDKRMDDGNYQNCLTDAIVERWKTDLALAANFHQTVIDCTCFACRLFGTPWLAGRLSISDLTLIESSWDERYEVRGGLQIERDTGIAIEGSRYMRKVAPAGLRFSVRLLIENATFAEQGMILLGLRAFEMGWVTLGADRSRGLGRGRLELDWWNCHYTDAESLIDALILREPAQFTESDAETRISALSDMLAGLSRRD